MKSFILRSTGIKSVAFGLLFLVSAMTTTAQNYTITFQDESIEMPENINTFQWTDMPESAELANGYVGWVQFYETPTQNVQDLFEANRLELIDYIPHHTYLFHFPATTSIDLLRNNGVRSIVPVEGRFKLSQNLKNGNIGAWAVDGNNILVTLQHHDNVSTDFVVAQLAEEQIGVVQRYDGYNNIDLTIPNNCLEDLSNLSYVKWVELIVAPSVPDDQRGRALHRASGLDTQTTAGRNYDGTGVGVLCRDDGAVGRHIDFQGRIFGLVGNNGNNNTHGDGVSGIMAGAGNKDPRYRGMAAGSDLHVVNYNPSFLDNATNDLIDDGSVQITNSSYSNGCNAGYTTITVTVDEQSIDTPELLHVFSAGNSNNLDCGYGAGNQWGNITGGHKQGKNVIATANTFYDGSLVNSSSRGPAHDGRIKPDIAANGQNQISTGPNNAYFPFGGTSGAAPGIAGVSAQLYQAYMETNGGTMPNSGLIKAILMNTANDAGNVGPDFKFGWGIVNGLRAGILIEDGRHLSDNVSQGNTNTHTINVPAGTTQLKVMVYWNDPAAAPGASPALVNDLDMEVVDPSSTTFQPWVLDSTPNPTALDTPATNGIDRLNNVEQVLINNPDAGDYDVEITGFNVPQGPQEYFVVYEIIENNLTVTFPNGGEKLRDNLETTIHWDAVNTTADFVVEFSTDNGTSWTTIDTVDSDTDYLDWAPPANLYTGEALIRVTSGAFSDVSDANFTVADHPVTTNLERVCDGEATISWPAVAEAESYDVYLLGEKYMEIVANVTTTEAIVAVEEDGNGDYDFWYSVAARNDTDGWVSQRRIATQYEGDGLECELGVDDFLSSTISLYPNPSNDQVFIDFGTSAFNNVDIKLSNSLGQTIFTQTDVETTNQTAINVSSYRTGLYFVTITADGQTTTKKLLVK
ncbi:S8 family serine peptidase [Marinirhabdus gelatinilytica]|uniref:Putative secreted protein (Por secretion system target) n=1 Tax=Marinirhabdus gelatinilytica TaxID=1703343 RepID=A0A370QJL8_9FLAO|nr:S8 family serine peptidase [Marinirhabdus gelatinilytica]RDK88558.1 putative secreted protein (Por secretion system target) [Marinirhabdus gelatinilytica]